MASSLLRTNNEISEIYQRHVKTVYRVCFTYLKNPADTEDAVSNTFIKMLRSAPSFESRRHEEAWLVRTAVNVCKDFLKHWWQRRENLENYSNSLKTDGEIETGDVLDAIFRLPEKYKAVIYLYYYEGYSSPEIADALKKPKSTIRNYLHEARNALRDMIGDEFDEA